MSNTSFSPLYKEMIHYVYDMLNASEQELHVTVNTNPDDFRKNYPEVVKKVFDRCLSEKNYELSYNQVSVGIAAFIQDKVYPQNQTDQETNK